MKNLIIAILFVFIASTSACAEWYYLVDIENNVVAKQNGPAKPENLIIDGFIQVVTDLDVSLSEAEYRGGKIVKHTKTQNEIDKENEDKDKADKKVADILTAKEKLMVLGLTQDEVDALHP